MKEITVYEDVNGLTHLSRQECILADAKIAVVASPLLVFFFMSTIFMREP